MPGEVQHYQSLPSLVHGEEMDRGGSEYYGEIDTKEKYRLRALHRPGLSYLPHFTVVYCMRA